MQNVCPFPVGARVSWSAIVPRNWLFLHTPGPMIVVDVFYQDGTPTEYARQFGKNGFDFVPGWIITVEYDTDSTDYYNPPLSLLFGKRMVKMVHEKWLVRA